MNDDFRNLHNRAKVKFTKYSPTTESDESHYETTPEKYPEPEFVDDPKIISEESLIEKKTSTKTSSVKDPQLAFTLGFIFGLLGLPGVGQLYLGKVFEFIFIFLLYYFIVLMEVLIIVFTLGLGALIILPLSFILHLGYVLFWAITASNQAK